MTDTIAIEVVGGIISPAVTISQLETAQTSGTHVGTASVNFVIQFNGGTITYRAGQVFIADPLLYAAINASTAAAACVTWSN